MYPVTISRPLALFRTTPQIHPMNTAIGVPSRAANAMPATPMMFQLMAKMRPICPAMAPRVMPKFSPMPA